MFKIWLQTLQAVNNSILCLLENPSDSTPFITEFIRKFDETLIDRVRFQPFINNPYDSQRRGALMCNSILDSQIYNGHTTAGDALWGGVPIITYGKDTEMSARVGMSALYALGLNKDLIVYSHEEYYNKAVTLGLNKKEYNRIRTKLVNTAYARPRNPFWDVRRYV